jgi:rhomboid protease GluP
MPFFIYGSDAKTGIVAKRVYTEAATEAEARTHAETLGLAVTSVVPCRADQNPAATVAKPLVATTSRRPAAGSALAVKEQKEAMASFTQTLEGQTPTTYVTYALIAINVLVFGVMVISGVSPTSPKGADLIHWGSDFGMYTVNGQWWRLFTSMFVHIGFLHLIYNMAAFYYVGPTVERMFGNLGFLVLYIVAGLGGGMVALYLDPMLIHAGASGAIFGVYGALLAVLLRERDSIPPQILANLKKYVGVFIAYNLVNSLRPGISMAAHVGGLLIGFICGFIAAQPLDADTESGRPSRNMWVAGVGVVLCVVGIFGMRAKYPNLDHMKESLDHFDTVEKKTHETFKTASERNAQEQLTNEQFADSIDRDMLPAWRTTRAEFDALPSVNSKIVDATHDYLHLRQEGLEAMSAALRSSDESKLSDAQEKETKADKLSSWAAVK